MDNQQTAQDKWRTAHGYIHSAQDWMQSPGLGWSSKANWAHSLRYLLSSALEEIKEIKELHYLVTVLQYMVNKVDPIVAVVQRQIVDRRGIENWSDKEITERLQYRAEMRLLVDLLFRLTKAQQVEYTKQVITQTVTKQLDTVPRSRFLGRLSEIGSDLEKARNEKLAELDQLQCPICSKINHKAAKLCSECLNVLT